MSGPEKTYQALIGMGSNIHPRRNLQLALEYLSRKVSILQVSSVWQSPPVGCQGPDYLNAAVLIETPLLPRCLKRDLLCRIEQDMGRVRTDNKNEPRPIDLDILIFAGKLVDQDLWLQAHVALPAAEILPGLKKPGSRDTLQDTADLLESNTEIFRLIDFDLPYFTGSAQC